MSGNGHAAPDTSTGAPSTGAPPVGAGGAYVGSELELFAAAVNWKRRLRRETSVHVRGDVLEVGAGIGATTAALRHDGVRTWTCLEPDPAFCATIEAAGARGALRGDVRVARGTLEELRAAEAFDTVLYIDVLEHIEDDRAEAARAARALRPGGRLVVVAPAHPWLFSPFDAAVGHHRRYTRPSLRAVMPDGLREVDCRYLDSAGMLASAANRLVLSRSLPTARQIRVWDRLLVPASSILDRLTGHALGKSLLGVWERLDG